MKTILFSAVMLYQTLLFADANGPMPPPPPAEYPGDAIQCEIKLWGDFESEKPGPGPGPYRSGERGKPTLITDVTAGGTRYEVPTFQPGLGSTRGTVILKTALPDLGGGVTLRYDYMHATELDATGKILRAAQSSCLGATLEKSGLAVTYANNGNCFAPEAKAAFDTNHPEHGEWRPMQVHKDIPDFRDSNKLSFESPSGMSILTVNCRGTNQKVSWFDELLPIGPVH